MWWFGMPAILKGWVDRTMARGFAYKAGRKYDTGMLKGRRAMICTTTGTASGLYEPDGIDGDINHILWPVHNGIFRYLGFDVLPPYIAWMPGRVSPGEREAYLEQYGKRLLTVEDIEPLFFHPAEDFGPDQRLKPGVMARSGFQWNPGAGQERAEAAGRFTSRSSSRPA
jgi:NAD(P)H dehydrogenase (quinone)